MSRPAAMSTTSFGVLGLLAVRPYSSYELTKAMGLSVGRVWPRAASKLFEEPKKLVSYGYATAAQEHAGRRPRTVYTITPAGRAALAAWLSEPGGGPSLEFEGLLKLIFAEFGNKADAIATIERARAWSVEMNTSSIAAGERFAEGAGRHQARHGQALLMGAFLTDFYAMVARWADWATEQIESWPEDIASHRPDRRTVAAINERARWSVRPNDDS